MWLALARRHGWRQPLLADIGDVVHAVVDATGDEPGSWPWLQRLVMQEARRGTLTGAILGAVLVNFGKTWFTGALPELWLYALGALFIVVTLFLPKGVMGLFERRARRKTPEPAPVTQEATP